jgi:hypothetical protein
MSLARGIERRLERLMDGIAARLFGGKVHPVELAERIVREADLTLISLPTGPVAHNHFVVNLGGDPADTTALGPVQRELEQAIEETAWERGWRLEGPAQVSLVVGSGGEASVRVESSVVPGPREAWARLHHLTDAAPIDVTHNRSVIGRSGESDAHIPAPEVSRRHALLWREVGDIWLADLGAPNGTYVNGEVFDDAIALVAGDNIGLGPVTLVFRPV